MHKFIDDLAVAGAVYDIVKIICYFFAGIFIVGVPLFLLAMFFEWLF